MAEKRIIQEYFSGIYDVRCNFQAGEIHPFGGQHPYDLYYLGGTEVRDRRLSVLVETDRGVSVESALAVQDIPRVEAPIQNTPARAVFVAERPAYLNENGIPLRLGYKRTRIDLFDLPAGVDPNNLALLSYIPGGTLCSQPVPMIYQENEHGVLAITSKYGRAVVALSSELDASEGTKSLHLLNDRALVYQAQDFRRPGMLSPFEEIRFAFMQGLPLPAIEF